jgi:hypothetical protein
LCGPVDAAVPAPPVRLRREWKGLTVADLLRDEIVERLPGQVRSALHHAARGDFTAAERALPGELAPVLPGPGSTAPTRPLWIAFGCVLAILIGTALAVWIVA